MGLFVDPPPLYVISVKVRWVSRRLERWYQCRLYCKVALSSCTASELDAHVNNGPILYTIV
jgi:hypothetical protein